MATFKDNSDSRQRIDFRIISNGWFQLYLSQGVLSKDVRWLEEEGYEVVCLDCSEPSSLMAQIKNRLSLPPYFHDNLDSLNDCLRDIRIKGIGLVVVFNHLDCLKIPDIHDILDVFVNTAIQNFIVGKRMMVLGQVDDKHFEAETIGAIEIQWNGKEWLRAARENT